MHVVFDAPMKNEQNRFNRYLKQSKLSFS